MEKLLMIPILILFILLAYNANSKNILKVTVERDGGEVTVTIGKEVIRARVTDDNEDIVMRDEDKDDLARKLIIRALKNEKK